jgi:RHS repeat-associated protein
VNWPGPDNLFGYTGLGYDYYSGLSYARARYYKPEMGRFISEDTYKGDLWNPQRQNGYTYVHNNPLTNVDPTGHWCESADGNWKHARACESASSTYSDDMAHDGYWTLYGGSGGFEYQYPVEDRYERCKYGDFNAFTSASEATQEKLWTMAKSDWTVQDAVSWTASGVLFGLGVVEFALEVSAVASFRALAKGKPADTPSLKYDNRVLRRMQEDKGPNHNFPTSFDSVILGNKPALLRPDGRAEHLVKGSINNNTGYYHITVSEGTITHRAFIPDSDWSRYSNRWGLPNMK